MLRVGGKIDAADWKSGNAAFVFFDSGVTLATGSTRALSDAYLGACWSAHDSSISCEEYDSADANANMAYYPVMRRIVLKTTIGSAATFNHYVAI